MQVSIPPPNKKQAAFFKARNRFVAYGGARGGGKSWAVRQKARLLALYYAGIRILIMRRTFPELRENHILPLQKDLSGLAVYRETDKVFLFGNGSRIKFGYCDTEKDVNQYQGQEFDVIFLDEATHFTELQFLSLTACLRGVNPFPKRMYLTCNPGGVGHAWVKRLFVDRHFKEGENPEDYQFIRASVKDNKAIMQDGGAYVRMLQNLPEQLRRAWLDGEWDVFAGQVFREWRNDADHYLDHKWTHVIAPFSIPDTWPRYRTLDWGYSRPFSVGYTAMSPEGKLIRYHEIYGTEKDAQGITITPNEGLRLAPDEVAERILHYEQEHEKGHRLLGIADPSIFDESRGSDGCVANIFARKGIYFDRGDNKRIPGKMQIHNRLAFDSNGIPGFQVFTTCRDFIRTIPALVYSSTAPEDIDTAGEDHIYDEWRYLCMAHPISPPPRADSPQPPPQDDPLNMLEDAVRRYV